MENYFHSYRDPILFRRNNGIIKKNQIIFAGDENSLLGLKFHISIATENRRQVKSPWTTSAVMFSRYFHVDEIQFENPEFERYREWGRVSHGDRYIFRIARELECFHGGGGVWHSLSLASFLGSHSIFYTKFPPAISENSPSVKSIFGNYSGIWIQTEINWKRISF